MIDYPHCRKLESRTREIEQQLAEVLARLADNQSKLAKTKLAETEAKLAVAIKNSSMSAKLPSSEIVKLGGVSRKRKSRGKRSNQTEHPSPE